MDAAAELGRNPVSKHQIQPEYGDEQADAGRDCRARLARPNSQARTRTAREIFIFPVQLTTYRTGNLTRLIHTLAICVTMHTYMDMLLYGGEMQNSDCRRLEMVTYFLLQVGEICKKSRQSCSSRAYSTTTSEAQTSTYIICMWRFYPRHRRWMNTKAQPSKNALL